MEGHLSQWPVYNENSQFDEPVLFPDMFANDFGGFSGSFDVKIYLLTSRAKGPIRWHPHRGL